MAEDAISKGSLRAIRLGEKPENAVVQCIMIKNISSGNTGAQERFRLVFSDTIHFSQSIFASQLNSIIHDGTLKKGNIVRLKQYQQQDVKGKKLIIVLDCDVLSEFGELEKIGNPTSLEGASNGREQEEAPPGNLEHKQQPEAIATENFYGQPQGQLQNKQSSLPSRVNGNSNSKSSSSHGNIFSIEGLSPYTHRWTIKARCTHKSDIKTWHNKNGEGKLFSVNLLDETGEIRGTGFNDQCDMLYEIFQEGSVYFISSPCRVQLAKKQFSNVNHDYELTFERDTVVEKAEDQDGAPRVRYNFTSVGDLQSVEKDTTIDTIGILQQVGEVSEIVSKTTSKPYSKRELTLVDNTGYKVRLTIWGNAATSFDVPAESVLAFKGVKVSDYDGRSLSLLSSGSMNVDPDIDEAHKLKGWYEAQGRDDSFQSHSAAMGGLPSSSRDDYKTIGAVKDEQLGMSEKADYFTVKATVMFVKSTTIAYPACQTEKCNKKVVEEMEGSWRCETCNKTWERPLYRYILSVNVSDFTGQIWLNCFDEVGRLLLGDSADELMALKENNEKAFVEKVADANCRIWIFRCRAKMETFQEQTSVRYQVSSAHPLNFQAECNRLTETLKQYSLNENSLFMN